MSSQEGAPTARAALRLSLRFEPTGLQDDLAQILGEAWTRHFNADLYRGDWSGVALRAPSDAAHAIDALHNAPGATRFSDLPILEHSPHFRAVMDRLDCELSSVRLLRLGPGAVIDEHTDHQLGWGHGEARLHLPVCSNPSVDFRVEGEHIDMRPGELWYIDASRPHAVRNSGDEARVHMVIDCRVNPWLNELLHEANARPRSTRLAWSPLAGHEPEVDDRPILPSVTETGSLGICHLKRRWSKALTASAGRSLDLESEAHLDRLVLDALGLGLGQTMQYLLHQAPTFSEFEEWVVATAGRPDRRRVDRFNADVHQGPHPADTFRWLDEIDRSEPVLTADDLTNWDEHGVVVLKQAVTHENRVEAAEAIWNHLGADPNEPESWYRRADHGIMVELIQHAALEVNRRSERIHKAFAQLWGTVDLWPSADRCGFHPPQRDGTPFPGPDLHWDMDLRQPMTFGTQGILYLTDTPPELGALTLVPGFHKCLSDWLRGLDGRDPQNEDLHARGSVPVGGSAGDMIIWHQALPHGSRPNLGTRPRMVQYINMYPGRPAGAPA